MDAPTAKLRVDKWLWFARFFKTRGLAAKTVTSGHVRVNGVRIAKASVTITPGDTLTFLQAKEVRVIKVVEIGTRRGPAPEAQTLYCDLSPPVVRDDKTYAPQVPRFEGKGRPTKKFRRDAELSRKRALE